MNSRIISKFKVCYICKEKFEDKHATYKKYGKVKDHCYYTGEYRVAAHIICNSKYSIPKEIPIAFTMDLTIIILS